MTTTTHTKEEELFDDPLIQGMADAGVFYGRTKNRTHPKMKQYIFATRNNVEILDLAKTKEKLDAASAFPREVVKGGGIVLFAGTLPSAKKATQEAAEQFSFPYVVHRWLGGTLSNFRVIAKRIDRMKRTRQDIASGALDKYKKKERVQIIKEFERLKVLMGGLEHLTKLPDALVVSNIHEHETAVREAKKLHIPVVAIAGTASNPQGIMYPIPANDTAKGSIEFVLAQLRDAVELGMKDRPKISKKVEMTVEEEKSVRGTLPSGEAEKE